MTKTVMVVDDERSITDALSILLVHAGYTVEVAHSGKEAIGQLSLIKPDLLLLDVMMPGLDGYQVCRHIREQERYTPIIMLTAKDQSWEKVTGLELGADVYMTKPFEPGELMAQVKALLRLAEQTQMRVEKGIPNSERPLVCGHLTLFPQQHRVTLEDTVISLSPKEFDLLQYFMQNLGRAIGRQTLLSHVWQYDYSGDSRTVDTHIQRLRAKIESNPAEPQLLQTVRGFGYRLVTNESEP